MNVLEEAASIVDGGRAKIYGPPVEGFERLAKVWSVILDTEINAHNVVLCLTAMKLLRLTVTPSHRDSKVDICGYTRILEMMDGQSVQAGGTAE